MLVLRSLADRLCQLADLLGQPCHRRRDAALAVAVAVGVAHEPLELFEVHNHCIFANRHDAGRALAARLTDLAGRDDIVVLGLPRGGVPVAYEVAIALAAPLDVFVVRKLGAPGQPELALGALASGGTVVINDEIVRHLMVSREQLDAIIAAQQREVWERDKAYRGGREPLAVEGRVVVVVDDGIATGASMRVALEALRSQRPASLVVAAPVAPPEMEELLRDVADRVEFAATPHDLSAVGAWYEDFHQISDEEVRRLLTT